MFFKLEEEEKIDKVVNFFKIKNVNILPTFIWWQICQIDILTYWHIDILTHTDILYSYSTNKDFSTVCLDST